jgi:hypothetical protein
VLTKSEYCFCGLALGEFYHSLALDLAKNLEKEAPGIPFLVLTDEPKSFTEVDNVIAIEHHHKFGYRPYNDKVFVLEEALKRFVIAILVDVDTRIKGKIEEAVISPWTTGITATSRALIEHTKKYNPDDLSHLLKLAKKLNLDPDRVQWVGESLVIIRKDDGKEKEFLEMWKKLARYWDIHGLVAKDGSLIGLASASVGWDVSHNYWQDLKKSLEHFDVQRSRSPDNWYQSSKKAWNYRLRIFLTKLSTFLNPELLP